MKRTVTKLQMGVSLDLIGSKMSMAASKNITLTELRHGLEMKSKASRRTVVIPYANIKGYEVAYTEIDEHDQQLPVNTTK